MLSTIPLAQDNLKTDSGFVVKKKISTVLPRMMESRATNCQDFTGKGHVLKQSISWLPHTPQAAFFPKAKNLTITFCVTFFKYFLLTLPKYIHFSQIVHMWVLGDC